MCQYNAQAFNGGMDRIFVNEINIRRPNERFLMHPSPQMINGQPLTITLRQRDQDVETSFKIYNRVHAMV